jgi:hypothetical protein
MPGEIVGPVTADTVLLQCLLSCPVRMMNARLRK